MTQNYDGDDRLTYASKVSNIYEGAKLKREEVTEEYFWYDASGNIQSSVRSNYAYEYDENGIVRKETYNAEIVEGGQLWWRCESEVKYDNGGNIIEGYQIDSYYAGGMLTQMGGIVGTSKDGYFRLYAVSYDIDASGNVTATHVYDESGNEVYGGSGFIHPSDIIVSLPSAEIEKNAEEKVVKSEENRFSEIMDRMAVQDEAARQAADHRFVNEMAPKPKLVEQPQPQN